jgi:uncharacterized protein DUF4352
MILTIVRRAAVLSVVALATLVGITATSAAGASRHTSATCSGHICRVGDTLSFKGTAYKVTRVRTSTRIGDRYLGGRTSGLFVIVSITFTDLKNRPSTILADNIRIRSRNGATYSVTDKAFAVYDNGLTILENLQPHLPDRVVAVYELPRNAVGGAQLQVRDMYSGTTAAIGLGV